MTDKEIVFVVWCSAISLFILYYSYRCICGLREKTNVEITA